MKSRRIFSSIPAAVAALCAVILAGNCSLFYEPLSSPKEEAPVTAPKATHVKNMVLIRARDSSFMMGDDHSVHTIPPSPAHSVRFTCDFFMDTTEVTQEDYNSLMKACYTSYQSVAWDQNVGSGPGYPAFGLSWYDAALYCNARSKRDGFDTVYRYTGIAGTLGVGCGLEGLAVEALKKGYRLPTEAEWEYACRAGTTKEFYWNGNEATGNHAWYRGNSGGRAHPVAGKSSNSFGLYDMSGNVAEWCNDWYSVYSAGAFVDPYGPPGNCDKRVVRGGSWFDEAEMTYSVSRYRFSPLIASSSIGFRVVIRADTVLTSTVSVRRLLTADAVRTRAATYSGIPSRPFS